MSDLAKEGRKIMAEFDIVDEAPEHEHAWVARGLGHTRTSLFSTTAYTRVLYHCEGDGSCGGYAVEDIPGWWTAAELMIDDTVQSPSLTVEEEAVDGDPAPVGASAN